MLNPQVAFTARLGVGVTITRVLAIKVRKSGEWRTTPVNLLNDNDHRYLVSPRVKRNEASAPSNFRTRKQILGLFDGLNLLDPGLVPCPDWRRDPNIKASPSAGWNLAGVSALPAADDHVGDGSGPGRQSD
jgi:S-adenosyl methyltransferase